MSIAVEKKRSFQEPLRGNHGLRSNDAVVLNFEAFRRLFLAEVVVDREGFIEEHFILDTHFFELFLLGVEKKIFDRLLYIVFTSLQTVSAFSIGEVLSQSLEDFFNQNVLLLICLPLCSTLLTFQQFELDQVELDFVAEIGVDRRLGLLGLRLARLFEGDVVLAYQKLRQLLVLVQLQHELIVDEPFPARPLILLSLDVAVAEESLDHVYASELLETAQVAALEDIFEVGVISDESRVALQVLALFLVIDDPPLHLLSQIQYFENVFMGFELLIRGQNLAGWVFYISTNVS